MGRGIYGINSLYSFVEYATILIVIPLKGSPMVIALIVFILVFVGLDVGISLLNYNQRTQPLPANVAGIYDEAAYSKWLAYSMEKLKLGLIQKAVFTLILVGLLGFGGFAWLNTFSESFSTDPVLSTLIFIGSFMGLQLIVGLPFRMDRYLYDRSQVRLQ
jgi:ABC-type sugar transport system permease subunit